MKTLIYFLLIPFGLFMTNHSVENNLQIAQISKEKGKTVKIVVEVEFGRHKLDCEGFGLCKGKVSSGIKGVLKGNRAIATMIAQKGKVTSIDFRLKSMNRSTIKKYFSDKYFVVGEDFNETFKYKNKKILLNLKEGKYKISKSKRGFLINL